MDRQWTEAISGKKKSSKTAHLRCFRAIIKMTRTGIESWHHCSLQLNVPLKTAYLRRFTTSHTKPINVNF